MKKVFILDDNEELLEIMQRLLSQEYLVKCSTETDNIVQVVNDFGPDLLLLDHSVGEMNSADIMAKLKTAKALQAPVVLFSAHPMLADMAALIGADGHIDKPSDIGHIRTYIKKLINQ